MIPHLPARRKSGGQRELAGRRKSVRAGASRLWPVQAGCRRTEAQASAGEGRAGGASRLQGTSRSGGVSTRRGKASWFDEIVVFDEAAVEAGLAASPGRARSQGRTPFRRGSDTGRQRPCHRLGARKRTPPPGDEARRSFRSRLRQDRVSSVHVGVRDASLGHYGVKRWWIRRSWRFAVKRSSTRGFAGGLWPTTDPRDSGGRKAGGGALENRPVRGVLVS